LLDCTKGFMSTTQLLGKIEISAGFCLLSALFWLVCRMPLGSCQVVSLKRRITHR
jgi:hypothetical protein